VAEVERGRPLVDALSAWRTRRTRPSVRLAVGALVLAAGALFAAGLVAFLVPPAAAWPRWARRTSAAGLPVALVAALGFALFVAHGLVPAVSHHVSRKALVDSYHRSKGDGAVLVRYRVPREGSGVFDRTSVTEVASAPALATLFRERPGAFALVPRAELAALDDAFATAGAAYAVVDASSSRLLLLAARLPAGAVDQHPLAANLWRPRAGDATERPPWPAPAQALSAVFGDAIELLGADFPPRVRRPGSLPLTLHFLVRQRPPPDYKIFVHLQRAGQPLLNGDHAPLGGAYPTQHWRPGDHLRDQHAVELPLVTTSAGRYALYCGFWPGGDNARRLPVTAGAQDGQNRVALGSVDVD